MKHYHVNILFGFFNLFLLSLLIFQSCVLDKEETYDKVLRSAIDSLEVNILSSDSLVFSDIEELENLKIKVGEIHDVIPYYMMKATQDNDTKSCYKVYELCKNVPYKREKMRLIGIDYLKKGALLQDSICENELNKIMRYED